MRLRRPLTVSTAAAVLVLGGSLPASAHPHFLEDEVPAGSLTTLTLALAHGCGAEGDAEGEPTTEVSVEVPAQVSYLVPGEVDGYRVDVEGDEGAVPDVVTWTATDGGVPAPELPMEAVVDGQAGDEIDVRVLQNCEEGSYRWVGTADDPADDPAVTLTLGEPDPDAPPPPDPTEVDPEDPATDGGEGTDAEAGADAGAEADADTSADADGTADEPAAATDAADGDAGDEEAAPAVEDLASEPPADEGGGTSWWLIVLGAVVLAGLGGLLVARRRPVQDPNAGDGTGMNPPGGGR